MSVVMGHFLVIDGDTDQIIGEIQLGDNLTSVNTIAVNTQTNRIYVGAYFFVTVIDGATNLKVGVINQLANDQYELAVNPVTNRVYISDYAMYQGDYDSVHVYDGETLALITTVNIPGSNTHPYVESVGVAVNPNTNKVYATWSGEDTLFMIDGDTNAITKTANSSFSKDEPTVMVNPYTNYVYVGGSTSFNGETLEVVPSTYFGNIRAVDPIHNFLYATESGTLHRVNGTTHEVIDSLKLPIWDESPDDSFAVNPKTSKIYITDTYTDQLYVISARTPTPSSQSTETPSSPPTASPSSAQTSAPGQTGFLPLSQEVAIIIVAIVLVPLIIVFVAVAIRRQRRKSGK